jgi:hypothetical protein
MKSHFPRAFGVSFAIHLLTAALLVISVAPPAIRRAVQAGVSSPGTVVVSAATRAVAKQPRKHQVEILRSDRPDSVPDDLAVPQGQSPPADLNLPGFMFDFAKISDRATLLFPFLALKMSFEPAEPAARTASKRLVNPLSPPLEDTSTRPLVLSDAELQALVDKTWSRRRRWTPFQPIAAMAETSDPDTGRLPALLRAYVEQNALQPYVDANIRDPRLWTELGIAADHGDFVDFIARFAVDHPSTKATTELLFLLEKLAQGSYDALITLLDTRPAEDLWWTRDSNREAHKLIVTLQRYYSLELERRGLLERGELKAHYDGVRLRILNGIVGTTPRGYRVNDARFLIGGIQWRAGRTADAVRVWREMTIDPTDSYVALYSDLLSALPAAGASGQKLDPVRVGNAVNAERGRWINFSYDRLRQFGYRFESF